MTVRTSDASASESLVRMLNATVLFSDTVAVSLTATGPSLAPVMVIVPMAEDVPPLPSLIV